MLELDLDSALTYIIYIVMCDRFRKKNSGRNIIDMIDL